MGTAKLEKDLTNRDLGNKYNECRICSAKGEFPSYLVREMFYGTREEFEYFSCPKCNCLQIAKIPEDIGRYYSEGYYSFSAAAPAEGFPETVTDNTEILDVGCGSGKWLIERAKEGYGRLFGCDPFIDEEKNYSDRIHIYKCSIHDIPGEKRFDLIRMADSLEHMDDPEDALRDAARLLKDDGQIEIHIPSWPNIVFDLFRAHWVQLDAPRHLWIPSIDTLRFIACRLSLYVEETHCDSNEVAIMLSFMYEHGISMKDMNDDMVRGFFPEDSRRNIRQTIFDANRRGEGDHRSVILKKLQTDNEADILKREVARLGYGLSEYETSKTIEELVEERINRKEYEESFSFLNWLFFEKKDASKSAYLSEGTMLLFIMLEATLAEHNRMDEAEFKENNTCRLYSCSYRSFTDNYLRIKHDIRRIWFGLSKPEQEELKEHIEKFSLSPELLAVLIKYSTFRGCYKDVYDKTAGLLKRHKLEEYAAILEKYGEIASRETETHITTKCMGEYEKSSDDTTIKKVYLTDNDEPADELFLEAQEKDNDRIAIIFCTNSELMEAECIKYLKSLDIPPGKKVEIISVWNAKGMCYGYNRIMRHTNAGYKLYIHHDSFIIKPDILYRLVELFENDEGWKMLGIAGSTVMEKNYYWASYKPEEVRYNLYQDRVLETILSQSIQKISEVDEAMAIDGVLIATSADIPWREDLFDGWHFYDISQCYEFRKKGYKTGLINDVEPWMLHETTATKDAEDRYTYYGRIFVENYLA